MGLRCMTSVRWTWQHGYKFFAALFQLDFDCILVDDTCAILTGLVFLSARLVGPRRVYDAENQTYITTLGTLGQVLAMVTGTVATVAAASKRKVPYGE